MLPNLVVQSLSTTIKRPYYRKTYAEASQLAYEDITLFVTITIYNTSGLYIKALIHSAFQIISYFPKYKNNSSHPVILKNFLLAKITLYHLFCIYLILLYTIYSKDCTPFIFKTFIEVRRFYNRERITSRSYNYPPNFIEAL